VTPLYNAPLATSGGASHKAGIARMTSVREAIDVARLDAALEPGLLTVRSCVLQ